MATFKKCSCIARSSHGRSQSLVRFAASRGVKYSESSAIGAKV
jgi:hypothetical protein